MKNFRTLYGTPIPNPIEYIKEYLVGKTDVEILIGSDSQSYGTRETIYGVVIALYTKGKGAHVLCVKEKTSFEKDMSSRLVKEVWKSVELAEYLKSNGIPKATYIDIDLNPDPLYNSNKVLRQAIGMVEGMGYKVRAKHMGASVTYAADRLVKS